MSLDVECVLPCDFWPPYRVICHGGTYSELFRIAKDTHDNECFCQLPLSDHAWVPTGKVSHPSVTRSETPPAGSRRVAMDEKVSKLSAEGCATVAWFFDSEYSDGTCIENSRVIFLKTPCRIRRVILRYPFQYFSYFTFQPCYSRGFQVLRR